MKVTQSCLYEELSGDWTHYRSNGLVYYPLHNEIPNEWRKHTNHPEIYWMAPLKLPDLNHYLALSVLAENSQEQLLLQVLMTATNLHYRTPVYFPLHVQAWVQKNHNFKCWLLRQARTLSTWIIGATQFFLSMLILICFCKYQE